MTLWSLRPSLLQVTVVPGFTWMSAARNVLSSDWTVAGRAVDHDRVFGRLGRVAFAGHAVPTVATATAGLAATGVVPAAGGGHRGGEQEGEQGERGTAGGHPPDSSVRLTL